MEILKTKIAIIGSGLTSLPNSEIETQRVIQSIVMNYLSASRVTKL